VAKVHKKYQLTAFLPQNLVKCNFYTIFNISYVADIQRFAKKLQKSMKKKRKKISTYQKKCLTLQRFN